MAAFEFHSLDKGDRQGLPWSLRLYWDVSISVAFSWSQGHLMVFTVGQNWDLMTTVGQSWITTVKDRGVARQRYTFSSLTFTGRQWMWMWYLHIPITAICNKLPVKIVPLACRNNIIQCLTKRLVSPHCYVNAQGLHRWKLTPIYNVKHPHSTSLIVKVKQIIIFVLY